jgi:hypothetical protein
MGVGKAIFTTSPLFVAVSSLSNVRRNVPVFEVVEMALKVKLKEQLSSK